MDAPLSRKWLRVHGAAASAGLAPLEAVRRQLAVDHNPTSLDGLRAALRCATPAESVSIALKTAEPRVVRIAAAEVARTPQLLTGADFRAMPAQEIWAHSLDLNAEAWRGPEDPRSAFVTVIQSLLDGAPADARLIAALSKTPVAELSSYPRCAELWPRVVNPARANRAAAEAG